MKLSCKYVTPSLLAALLAISVPCLADTVNIGVGGNLYGSYTLGANQSVSETFTLVDTTHVTSLSFGIAPEASGMMFDGSYQVIVSGAGGIYYVLAEQTLDGSPSYQVTQPLPDLLPAGQYNITFAGGPCGNPCYGYVAGIDYYYPGIFQGVGGSAEGPFGFDLTGDSVSRQLALEAAQNNVPEPSSWVLAATALALIPVRRYWLRKS